MRYSREVAPLRAELDATFVALPERLRAPGQGVAVCELLSDLYDRALASRFAAATADLTTPLALVATGGWARRDLAPYSDIDFIVLHDRDEAAAKVVADRLLYPLWDEKLAIGHALREPRAAARLAKGDLATATALLDARHIAGERGLSTELVRATLAAVAPTELVAMLASEQQARHDRFGASIYLLEPNLKQGIGALRDLATALWAAQIRWRPPQPGRDPERAEDLLRALAAERHLTQRQVDVLARARDFQLRIRALVQLAARRRFDQLTFEIQEAIAPALYPEAHVETAVAPAVEALMQEYYLHARGVVQVTDQLLEAAREPARGKPKIARVDGSFICVNGELAVEDVRRFPERPSEMVRLFRIAARDRLPVAAYTRELVAENAARLAHDPLAARLLRDALADLADAGQVEAMHQLGVLNALMPEWAPCTARVQHDLYHVYTVDQHQLYALAMQKQLARGELATEHPLATELWREVKRPAAVLLGTLLHDVGKPAGKGHAEKGAVLAGAIARRLQLGEGEPELVEFLVRQHLTMSHLSQRRDLADPEVIARFAEKVEDDEHLVALYLVTLCDTAMTAPGNLTAWKDDLLRDLVLRTRAHFRGPAPPVADAGHARVVQLAGTPDAAAIVEGIDPRLFGQLTPRQAARHVQLIPQAKPVALEVHGFPLKGHSEVAIVAPDAPGVLARLTGGLAAHRVDVLGAIVGHVDLPDGRRLALDLFFVRDGKGAAIPDDDPRWPRLAADLRSLLAAGPEEVAALIAQRRPPSGMPARVTPGVATEIKLHDDSTQATIVEVTTRDRVGVLHAITRTLAELELDISLAKVSTEGEKVADTFYVTRAGKRLVDEADRAQLVARLAESLDPSALPFGSASRPPPGTLG